MIFEHRVTIYTSMIVIRLHLTLKLQLERVRGTLSFSVIQLGINSPRCRLNRAVRRYSSDRRIVETIAIVATRLRNRNVVPDPFRIPLTIEHSNFTHRSDSGTRLTERRIMLRSRFSWRFERYQVIGWRIVCALWHNARDHPHTDARRCTSEILVDEWGVFA